MEFLSSYPGQYIVQTVLHSIIVAAVVEAMLYLWRIGSPRLQTRFRFLVLLLPVLSPLLFILLYPSRTGVGFRGQVALFDMNRWLGLGLGGGIYVWHLFVAALALTAVYSLIRELLPGHRHHGERRRFPEIAPGEHPRLDSVLAGLAGTGELPSPEVLLSPEAVPVVYTLGRRTLVVSRATLDLLDADELETVIAHELAHMTRETYVLNQLAALLRLLTFYNPVALLVFHRIINDTEKHCDAVAVGVTGKKLALASGLLKVYRGTAGVPVGSLRRLARRLNALERRAHANLIKERLERLAHSHEAAAPSFPQLRLMIVAGMLVALLFFVV